MHGGTRLWSRSKNKHSPIQMNYIKHFETKSQALLNSIFDSSSYPPWSCWSRHSPPRQWSPHPPWPLASRLHSWSATCKLHFYKKPKMRAKKRAFLFTRNRKWKLNLWLELGPSPAPSSCSFGSQTTSWKQASKRGSVEYSIRDYLNIEKEGTRLLVCWLISS